MRWVMDDTSRQALTLLRPGSVLVVSHVDHNHYVHLVDAVDAGLETPQVAGWLARIWDGRTSSWNGPLAFIPDAQVIEVRNDHNHTTVVGPGGEYQGLQHFGPNPGLEAAQEKHLKEQRKWLSGALVKFPYARSLEGVRWVTGNTEAAMIESARRIHEHAAEMLPESFAPMPRWQPLDEASIPELVKDWRPPARPDPRFLVNYV